MNYFDETGPAHLLDMCLFCSVQWSSVALQASASPAQPMHSRISTKNNQIKLCNKILNKKLYHMREQRILPFSNKLFGFEERLCNLDGLVWSQRPNYRRRTKIVTYWCLFQRCWRGCLAFHRTETALNGPNVVLKLVDSFRCAFPPYANFQFDFIHMPIPTHKKKKKSFKLGTATCIFCVSSFKMCFFYLSKLLKSPPTEKFVIEQRRNLRTYWSRWG